MHRRRFLTGLLALATWSAAGCQRNADAALRVAVQQGALPPQLLTTVRAAIAEATSLRVVKQDSLAELFQQLQQWHAALQSDPTGAALNPADWICLSDYWLLPAIQQELVSPLENATQLSGWETLPPVWSTVLRRNQQGMPTEDGAVWGTPYRWQHLMMVYDRRYFDPMGWAPTAWSDLLRPELRERISLPNHPRWVLGLLLKSLNYSANVPDPNAYPEVVSAVDTLRSQVKVYATAYYLQSLIVGDVSLAVGWSHDIQPLLSRYRYLQAVSPAPGTLLSADVWAKPNPSAEGGSAIALSALDQQWLQYWWQPEVVTPLSLFAQGLSPLLLSPEAATRPFELSAETPPLNPEQLKNSEFVQPLDEAAIANYTQLWRRLRGGE